MPIKSVSTEHMVLPIEKIDTDYDSSVTGFPLVYLKSIVDDAYRPYKGKVHVTDIIECMRQPLLKEKTYFDLNLDKAFPLITGTAIHRMFDIPPYSSIKVSNDYITGEIDTVEPMRDGEERLWDFKFVKSYAAKLALGMESRDIPIMEFGLPVLNKSGKNAGRPKTRKEYYQDIKMADTEKYAMQLNTYRFLRELEGHKVKDMYIFMGIKDADTNRGTYGIYTNTIHFRVPKYEPDFFDRMNERAKILINSMEASTVIDPGEPTMKEVWDGRKCNEFCAVKDACKAAFNCRYIKE